MKKILPVVISAILTIVLVTVSITAAMKPTLKDDSAEDDLVTSTSDVFPAVGPVQPSVVASASEEEPAVAPVSEEPVEQPQEELWHFYNKDLQDDDDAKNDFNFGPNPIPEVIVEAGLMEELNKGTSLDKIIEQIDPKLFDKNMRGRIVEDPALGSANMAWTDSLTKTNYLGVFYSECSEKWDAAIEKAKTEWIANPGSYNATLEAFFEFLGKAEKVEVRKVDKKLEDQMFMNPEGVNGVPVVIVMETDEHSGYYLVYTFRFKETKTVEVKFRIDCGYQPTDVAKVMNITPTKKKSGGGGTVKSGGGTVKTGGGSVITGGGGKITPTPTHTPPPPGPRPDPTPTPKPTPPGPTPDPPGPTPTPPTPTPPTPTPPEPTPPGPTPTPPTPTPPTPTPTPTKDPTQGTQVLPNDDPGPGKNTNNPDNPGTSTEEKPSNSNNMTQDDYNKAIDDMKDANETSKEAGTPNTPSTTVEPATPSEPVYQDNNGDTGTGHGGADAPTETHDSSVSGDPAGEAWGGPPD